MSQDMKLSKFLEAINKDAFERRQRIIAETEKFNIDELNKAEEDALNDVVALIEKEDAEIRNELKAEMSQREMESRKKILQFRENTFEKILSDAKAKILNYAQTDEYKKSLLISIKDIINKFNMSNYIIQIKPNDIVAKDQIEYELGAQSEVVYNPDIELGGFLILDSDSQIMIDETLDSKLENQRDWFIRNSDLSILFE